MSDLEHLVLFLSFFFSPKLHTFNYKQQNTPSLVLLLSGSRVRKLNYQLFHHFVANMVNGMFCFCFSKLHTFNYKPPWASISFSVKGRGEFVLLGFLQY